MKRFPTFWVLQAGALLILGFASVPMVRAIEQGPSGEFEIVESSRTVIRLCGIYPAVRTVGWALKWATLWWRFPVARINYSGRSLIRFPVNVY